jgi:3',5'-cyclic AMP phosphodiesterase CpdA
MTTIWIMSDLHTNASPWVPPPGPRVDIAIVAGDVADGLCRRALPWLAEHVVPRAGAVIYVPGNHDFYGTRMPDEIERARHDALAAGIRMLDLGQALNLGELQVIGATLWSDYRIGGEGTRASAMATCGDRDSGMRDHRRIQTRDRRGTPAAFRPQDAAALHARHRARIEEALAAPWDGPRIVVTHHAPHPASLLHGEAHETIDAAYASDLSSILEGEGAPDIWIHGHVHASRDYRVGRTRIVANPRGHDTSFRRRDGTWVDGRENPRFDGNLVVEI